MTPRAAIDALTAATVGACPEKPPHVTHRWTLGLSWPVPGLSAATARATPTGVTCDTSAVPSPSCIAVIDAWSGVGR